jgi:hypothetical protein
MFKPSLNKQINKKRVENVTGSTNTKGMIAKPNLKGKLRQNWHEDPPDKMPVDEMDNFLTCAQLSKAIKVQAIARTLTLEAKETCKGLRCAVNHRREGRYLLKDE